MPAVEFCTRLNHVCAQATRHFVNGRGGCLCVRYVGKSSRFMTRGARLPNFSASREEGARHLNNRCGKNTVGFRKGHAGRLTTDTENAWKPHAGSFPTFFILT